MRSRVRKESRAFATPVFLCEHKNIFHSQPLSSTLFGALPEGLGPVLCGGGRAWLGWTSSRPASAGAWLCC